MGNTSWKELERWIAGWLGTTRIGPTGDDGPDVITEHFAVQCKFRKDVPKWLMSAIDNAVQGAIEGRLPFTVIKKKYTPYSDSLIILRQEDFARLIKHCNLDSLIGETG